MLLSAEARSAAVRRFASYYANPRAFVYDLFTDTAGRPLELQPYQLETMETIAASRDVTVRSGHGVGKTTTDALILIWYLCTRPFSKVMTTAPTFRQVKDILWAEVAKWYQHFRLRDQFTLQKTALAMKGHEARWFARGVASNRPENIEGFHAYDTGGGNILFIVDEAKGVAKPIFDSIDGALTTGGQRLYTSTPGSRTGQFYESHHGRLAKFFYQIHVNAEAVDAPWVNRRWREQKAEEWGRGSPIYQAKVLGEFPAEGADILIRLDWIVAAEDAWHERDCAECGKADGECAHTRDGAGATKPAIPHALHRAIGCDVARFGTDETATVYGSSARLEWVRSWRREDTVETASRLARFYREANELLVSQLPAGGGCDAVGVDDTGLGGGVTDQLIKIHHVPCMPVIFGSTSALDTPDRKEHYADNKAWLAWKFRSALEENWQARERGEVGTFGVCPDDRLKGQLSNLRTRHTQKGKVRIIDPDDPDVPVTDLPKGVKVSPDRAHAAIIMYHTATSSAGIAVGRFSKPPESPRSRPTRQGRYSSYIFGGPRGRLVP